jgi:hypothetical protein
MELVRRFLVQVSMTMRSQRSMAAGIMGHGYAVFLVGAHGELDMNTFSSCSHSLVVVFV